MRREIMKSIISICILLCLTILASGMASAQGEYPTSVPAADLSASLASGLATGQASPLAACPQYGQAAAEGTYGTKVIAGDSDVGLPLSQFLTPPQAAAWVFYWDIGSTSGMYDDNDVVYLRFGAALPAQVQANNIRLTGWGNYPAGSYVKPGDSDIGQALIMPAPPLPSVLATGFYYMDLTGGAGYDLGDPVYLKVQAPAVPVTGTNDIRITECAGFPAGSRVSLIDPDANNPLTGFDTWLPWATRPTGGPIPVALPLRGPVAELAFYNANGNTDPVGNPIYDGGDLVYFDIAPGAPVTPIVSPNDVRLY
jgi:hypothetical protein